MKYRIAVWAAILAATLAVPVAAQANPAAARAFMREHRAQLHTMTVLFARPHGKIVARKASGLGWQEVVTKWDPNFCIGIAGASMNAGAAVKQGDCNGAQDQQWLFQTISGSNGCTYANPCWQMVNGHSHLCFDFQYNRFANWTPVIQYYCNGSDQAQELGLDATGGSAWGNCQSSYFDIHHWSIYSPFMAAEPGQDRYTPADLIEYAWWSGPGIGGTPPWNGIFWESPGGC